MRGGSGARSNVHGDLHRKTPWSKLRQANGRHTLVYSALAPTTRASIIASPDVHDLTLYHLPASLHTCGTPQCDLVVTCDKLTHVHTGLGHLDWCVTCTTRDASVRYCTRSTPKNQGTLAASLVPYWLRLVGSGSGLVGTTCLAARSPHHLPHPSPASFSAHASATAEE